MTIRIELAPAIVGAGMRESQLAVSAATLLSGVGPPMTDGFLFRVECDEYYLAAGVQSGRIGLHRNGLQVDLPIPPGGPVVVMFAWSPTSLFLRVGPDEIEKQTPVALVPNALREWLLRKRLEMRAEPLAGPREVWAEVCEQISALGAKLRETRGLAGFWNGEMPKPERDVNPIIQSYLCDLALTKGIQVLPEHPAGSGRMDFLFVAPVRDGTIAKVCAEVKLAHSDKLAHGLQRQLPEYMDSERTDYGVFVAVDFGPRHPVVSGFELPNHAEDTRDLDFSMQFAAKLLGRNVAALTLPVFQEKSPSR